MKCPKCGSKELKKITCCGGKTRYRCQSCNTLSRPKDVKIGKLPSQIAKEKKEHEKETKMVLSRPDTVD